jgi:hypothetical protein
MAAGGMDKSAMMSAMQSGGEQDQSGNQYAPGQQISGATQQYTGGQQQINGGNQTYGSMMGKFSGGGWR